MDAPRGPLQLEVDAPDDRIEIVHHHDERGVWASRGRDVVEGRKRREAALDAPEEEDRTLDGGCLRPPGRRANRR
jgi:hypothetical protein